MTEINFVVMRIVLLLLCLMLSACDAIIRIPPLTPSPLPASTQNAPCDTVDQGVKGYSVRHRGQALLVIQTDSELVVENISGAPLALRISWDHLDPYGIGKGENSCIDNWVMNNHRISHKLKNHQSTQIWAWAENGRLIEEVDLLLSEAKNQSKNPSLPQLTTVSYTPTTTLFPQPERGFYHHTETHSDNYIPLDITTLQGYRQHEHITLILRMFYLEDFVNSDISQTYLDAMQADFDIVREAQFKVIVRFAYTNHLPSAPPYGDATKVQIFKHLEQLRPVLQANSDVIAVIQAGLVGIWGEWYYTDYFVEDPNNPGRVTQADWLNRAEILAKILDVLPSDRSVQVRTPLIAQKIYNLMSPISGTEAHSGRDIARIGYHNDCFLASDTDFGTYTYHLEDDKAFLQAETVYLPMGGETCNLNPPRSECSTALQELARFHWSYLNIDYHPEVLASWSRDCLDEVKRRLGYRVTLIEGIYSNEVRPGDEFSIEVKIANEGWAAPFNPRLVELLLRHTTSGLIYDVTLPDDPRFWLADDSTTFLLTHTICTPADMPSGDYELLLNLPDPELSLYSRPEYAIRFANGEVWEENSGYNNLLHTISVNKTAINTTCNGLLRLETRDDLPLDAPKVY